MSAEPLERDAPALAGMLVNQIRWGLSRCDHLEAETKLTPRDKNVLLTLIVRANRVNGYCYASLSDLAKDLSIDPENRMPVTSVSKSVRNLKEHGLIDIEQRGKQLKNFYSIRWPGYDE